MSLPTDPVQRAIQRELFDQALAATGATVPDPEQLRGLWEAIAEHIDEHPDVCLRPTQVLMRYSDVSHGGEVAQTVIAKLRPAIQAALAEA